LPVFLPIFFKTLKNDSFMAKSKKKPAKSAKKASAKAKPAKKAKPAPKAKKAAPKKVKKVVKKAAAPKKVVAKKAPAKKAAPKAEVKKVVKKEVEKPMLKRAEAPMPAPKKEHRPIAPPIKLSPSQLNIFPIVNKRPIAHKSTKPAVDSDKTRYSDEELKWFEDLIIGKLNKAKEEFLILKDTLNRNNDAGTDSTSGGNTKVLEDGAETAEKENLSQLAARQQKFITNLENALVRIKNGTYGICSVTGKLIPKDRLIAVPHTTQSIEAKMMKKD
jgi:RNA polymerase-binding transcription factor DksA